MLRPCYGCYVTCYAFVSHDWGLRPTVTEDALLLRWGCYAPFQASEECKPW